MVWFAILFIIAASLALSLPPDPHTLSQLHISSLTYRVAIFFLLIPYIIIWYAAFFAFARLKNYVHAIKGSKDGKAFRKVMIGMGVLAFGLIIPTIVSLVMNNIAMDHNGLKPLATIIPNYLAVLTVILSFWFMGSGAHILTDIAKIRLSLRGLRWLFLIIILLSTFFSFLVLKNHFGGKHIYYLATYPLILTIIVPYVYAWFMALLCAYEFRLYSRHTKGIVYRQALGQFSIGIVLAVAGSVASQFVNNTLTPNASHSLGGVLVIAYALLVVILAGLVMMARGVRQLNKIEEV